MCVERDVWSCREFCVGEMCGFIVNCVWGDRCGFVGFCVCGEMCGVVGNYLFVRCL